MPNILTRWAADMEYKLYYADHLCAEKQYNDPYVLVYDIFKITDFDWKYMWVEEWTADRDCTSLCTENFTEWVVCDKINAVNLLLKEGEYIVDHYPFSQYAELVKTYCSFKEEQARRIVKDANAIFPSYKALGL